MNTKQIGDTSEAVVIAELIKSGKTVLLPFGDNQRYDIGIDDGGKLIRVQVKTGKLKNGVIIANTCSSACSTVGRTKRTRQNYKGQADLFAIYCFETNKVYLISVSDVGDVGLSLRIDAPKNNQTLGVKWAKDYEL